MPAVGWASSGSRCVKSGSITLNTLNDLCRILQCDVADVIRYIPEE